MNGDTVAMEPATFGKLLNAAQGKQDTTQFRHLVKQVSGREVSTVQVENFLEVFEEDLQAELTATRRRFIEKHFGTRTTTNR